MKTTTNPFDKFINQEHQTAYIESLGSEITYRKLTMAEDDDFNLRLLKGSDQKNPQMNLEEASLIKYEKIALALIEPKITVKKLQSMSDDASDVLVEILNVIEGKKEVIDSEGNSKS